MYQKPTLEKYNAKINFKLFLESTWSIVDWLVVRFTYSRGERTLFQTFGKSFKEVLDNFLAREKISISFHYKPELHCNQTPSANFLKQTNNTEYMRVPVFPDLGLDSVHFYSTCLKFGTFVCQFSWLLKFVIRFCFWLNTILF